MARLPMPGGDDDSWGSILNGFLTVSLNGDGTLNSGALKQAGAVTSVNGKVPSGGMVTLTPGDIGADVAGAAAAAQSAAEASSLPRAGGTMAGAFAPAVVALTDAATIGLDASKGNEFRITLTGSHVLGNPTNAADGQKITVVVNPATFTLSYGTAYNWGSVGAPVLTASKDNYLGFIYNAPAAQWRGVAYAVGY